MSYQSDVAYVFSIDDFAKVCKDAINEGTKTLYEFQHMMNIFSREYFNKNGIDLICIHTLGYSYNLTMTTFMKNEVLKYPCDFAYVGEEQNDFMYDSSTYGTLVIDTELMYDYPLKFIKFNGTEID